MLNRGWFQLFAQSATKYSTRAIDLVQRSTIVDMLNPFTLIGVLAPLKGDKRPTWFTNPETFTAADFQRFKDSRIDAMHIGVGTVGPNAYDQVTSFIGYWNGFIAHHADKLMRVDDSQSIDAAKSTGKIGIILGLQNSEHFRTPDDVDRFYQLGQRVSLLTYNSRNLIGNGSTERHDDGISDFGIKIVERMNKVGMAVDTAHCGDRTTLEAFEISKAPVLITHANCRALNPEQPRCKTDEAIRKMADKGGVTNNPQGPDSPFDPSEPGEKKRVHRAGSFLCNEQYCSRYIVGTRGKGEVNTGTNHLGFRCVKSARAIAAK